MLSCTPRKHGLPGLAERRSIKTCIVKSSKPRIFFWRYFFLNLLLVAIPGLAIIFLMGGFNRDAAVLFSKLMLSAVVIISLQYPLLARYATWGKRFLIFLFGMLLGLFLFGLFIGITRGPGNYLTGGIMTMIMGSILGILPCGFTVLVNWLLEKYLFPAVQNDVRRN